MIRPKKTTNRIIDQWEQDLLLKVMQRKIKTAKSTIPGVKKSHRQSAAAVLKPRSTCSLEWNFSNMTTRLPLVRTSNPKGTASLSPRQLNQKSIMAKLKDTDKNCYEKTPKQTAAGGVEIHELEDDKDEDERSDFDTDVETVGPDLESDEFLTDEFENTDDDLLSQLWNTCKREDALLDDALHPKQRRVGPTTTAVFYLNTSTVSDPRERSTLPHTKENRCCRKLSLATKKSRIREVHEATKCMKKREDGWRE